MKKLEIKKNGKTLVSMIPHSDNLPQTGIILCIMIQFRCKNYAIISEKIIFLAKYNNCKCGCLICNFMPIRHFVKVSVMKIRDL